MSQSYENLDSAEAFLCLTDSQRKILDAFYLYKSAPRASESTGHPTAYVYRVINSDEGKRYLTFLKEHNGCGIDRDQVIEELKNIALANYDDLYKFKESKNDEDEEEEDKKDKYKASEELVLKTFREMTEQQRRRVLSCFKINKSKYGTNDYASFDSNMAQTKLQALNKLLEIEENISKEKNDSIDTRSGQRILDTLKRLSGMKKQGSKNADN